MSSQITRRTLLKQAAAATALSYTRVLGANDRVRMALVGFSDRAQAALIPAFFANAKEQNFEMVAVSDIWKLRREEGCAFVEKFGGQRPEPVRNNDELYARKDVDAVIISTADFQHAPHGVEAVRAGRDAFIEKPLANQMADARAILKAVKETGRVVQIGTQRRSGTPAIKAREFIQSGQFGELSMVRLINHVNQPGRWRRTALVAKLRQEDTDWNRWRMRRSEEPFDARKYIEFRLFWPYSSGIFDQWMVHQIDSLHMITGLSRPRSVVASGGIYQFRDGRVNPDTVLAVFDYGPLKDPAKGFQVEFSSRMGNSAGGADDYYYSERGTLVVGTGKVTPEGGLTQRYAAEVGKSASLVTETKLFERETRPTGATPEEGVPRADATTSAHMKNWMQCIRTRKAPVADIEAGYSHSIALCMAIAALHSGKRAKFDEKTQEVVLG